MCDSMLTIWLVDLAFQEDVVGKQEELHAEFLEVKRLLLQVISTDAANSKSGGETTRDFPQLPLHTEEEFLATEKYLDKPEQFTRFVSI